MNIITIIAVLCLVPVVAVLISACMISAQASQAEERETNR